MPIQPTSTSIFKDHYRTSLVVGPSGIGKTRSMATASAQRPAWVSATVAMPPPDAVPVRLTDIAVLGFDSGGGSCFPAAQVEIANYYDFSDVPYTSVVAEIVAVLKELQPKCVSGEIGHVFLDTVTALDHSLLLKHGAKENNAKFRDILSDYGTVLGQWKLLKAHSTIFAQPKAVWDASADATKQREIKGLPGAHAKISGDALDRIRADVDFRFWVKRRKDVVAGKPVEKVVWLTNDREHDCKDRVYGNLPPEIDADFGALFAWGGAK